MRRRLLVEAELARGVRLSTEYRHSGESLDSGRIALISKSAEPIDPAYERVTTLEWIRQ